MQGGTLKKTADNIICSIQSQVVILKIEASTLQALYFDVLSIFFQRFHYVHLTTCVRLEEIIDH